MMDARRRKELEDFIWRRKHRDGKSILKGERAVLMNGGALGTILAQLSGLSDEELLREAKILGWKGEERRKP